MNEFPQDFYDLLAAASAKTRLREAVRAGAGLVTPCDVQYTLPIYLQIWTEAHDVDTREVVSACIDLGRYIQLAYLRANEIGTPYAMAVLNSDRLKARAVKANYNTSGFIDRAKALIARADFSGRYEVALPDEQATQGFLKLIGGMATDHGDPIQLSSPQEIEQVLSGEAITYLFRAAVIRGTTPVKLLVHCVATGLYLDRNFYLHRVPGASMSKHLISKALRADKLARELSNTLSGLETMLVDWDGAYDRLERKLNKAMGGVRG